jgi:cobalt-zinc-cadmium efflux system outer membrane protein
MRKGLWCASAALFASVGCTAETLSLVQALDLADRSHPQLAAGDAVIDAARAGVVTARARPNPEVALLGGRQFARVRDATPGADIFYSMSQPLEFGRLRPTRIAFAEQGVQSSEFFRAEARLAVLGAVKHTFYEVLRRQNEIQLAADNLRRVEDLRRRIQALVNVGESGTLELNRADAEISIARTYASSARLQLDTAIAQFRAAVGAPVDPNVTLQGELETSVRFAALEELEKEAVERHPTLLLARSEIRRAQARLDYETALRRPQPSLRTEVEVLPDSPAIKVGVSLPVNIFNRREGPIAEAAAGLRQTNHLAEARRLEVVAALQSAYGRFQVANQQIASFEQGVLTDAERALQGVEGAYQLGERGIMDVLDAQRVLKTVRQDYLNAQYDRQGAIIDIDQLRATDLRRSKP